MRRSYRKVEVVGEEAQERIIQVEGKMCKGPKTGKM